MLISPDRPCESCGSVAWDLRDDGRVCMECGDFVAEWGIGYGFGALIAGAQQQGGDWDDEYEYYEDGE
jgi:hypothetical protein